MDRNFYSPPTAKPKVFLLMGTTGLNVEETTLWNTTQMGEVQWDADFNLNKEKS
jgi:hypothetical protein